MSEWSKEHAWKVCMRQKCIKGSNPFFSAIFCIMNFYAYILKSEKDNRFYYGSTMDIEKRMSKHNKGDVKATKYRRPLSLHYFETFETRSDAYKREHFFKSIEGYRWLKDSKII